MAGVACHRRGAGGPRGGRPGVGDCCPSPRPEGPMSRRELYRVVAAAVASPALSRLSGDELWAVGRRAHAPGPRYVFRGLDPHQAETVEMIADLIIPQTETPGARAARLPRVLHPPP